MNIHERPRGRWSRAAFLCAALSARLAQAQAMEQVPADAQAMLWIRHAVPSVTATKPATRSAVDRDPVTAVEAAMGVRPAGLDPARDAVIYLPSGTADRDLSPVVLVLPVADYAAFIAAQPVGGADDGVTAFRPSGRAADTFVRQRGRYAAVSRVKESLARDHAGLKLSAEDRATMTTADVAFYVNGPALTGVLDVGTRRGGMSSVGGTTRPSDRDLPLGRSKLDREIEAADQVWCASGWPLDAGDLR